MPTATCSRSTSVAVAALLLLGSGGLAHGLSAQSAPTRDAPSLSVELRPGLALVPPGGIRDVASRQCATCASGWVGRAGGGGTIEARLLVGLPGGLSPYVAYHVARFGEEDVGRAARAVYWISGGPERFERQLYQAEGWSVGTTWNLPRLGPVRLHALGELRFDRFHGESRISGPATWNVPGLFSLEGAFYGASVLETERGRGWAVGLGSTLAAGPLEVVPELSYVSTRAAIERRNRRGFLLPADEPAPSDLRVPEGSMRQGADQRLDLRSFQLGVGVRYRLVGR